MDCHWQSINVTWTTSSLHFKIYHIASWIYSPSPSSPTWNFVVCLVAPFLTILTPTAFSNLKWWVMQLVPNCSDVKNQLQWVLINAFITWRSMEWIWMFIWVYLTRVVSRFSKYWAKLIFLSIWWVKNCSRCTFGKCGDWVTILIIRIWFGMVGFKMYDLFCVCAYLIYVCAHVKMCLNCFCCWQTGEWIEQLDYEMDICFVESQKVQWLVVKREQCEK